MGYTSLKFKNIEKYLINILLLIVGNQNIARYVMRLDNDPLDSTKPDVFDDLIELKNVIPTMFDNTITEYSEVKIFLYPARGSLQGKPLGDVYMNVDILVPDICNLLEGKGQFRTFRIADEITQMVDGQSEIAGCGQMNVVDFINYKLPNTNYCTLSMRILINSVTLKV